jgi:ketosteroid isomerase-like protein
MAGSEDRTEEARAAYARYVAARQAVEAGERGWASLADEFFTDDVVFVDPAWGRTEGRDAVTHFLEQSMTGLDDWRFPEEWTMVDGDRVVSMWWNRLPGPDVDGRPPQAPGISVLRYAGDGRFDHELDVLNMAEVNELIAATGWSPAGAFNLPPAQPERDPRPPARD